MFISLGNRTFTLTLWPVIFYFLLISLLVSLGFWQLDRAQQKQLYIQQQGQTFVQRITLFANTKTELAKLRYKQLTVTGRYDKAHQFLLDNQIYRGKVGYFVLTPLLLAKNQAVLVNRGWIPAPEQRERLPELPVMEKKITLTGRFNAFPSIGIKLKGADVPEKSWPARVGVVNADILAEKLGYNLFPFQVELNPNETEGFVRDWKTVTVMPAEKHIAYAVQWFALALTLTLLSLWMCSKKTDD